MEPIEEIKQKLNVVSFITPYVPLKQAGRNFKGLCPFHAEKTPSFMVSPERQMWHCFGCSKGGDVIAFYQQIERLEFYEALKSLAERTGVTLKYQEPEQVQQKNRLLKINELAAKFYHYLLTEHKIGQKALEYVTKERKLLPKTIETFQLGYAPQGWDKLANFLKKHKVSEKEAYQAGLVGRNTRGVYDMFRDRIIFPLHDHRGNIVGFAGRVLQPDIKMAKYINTPETPVYIKGNTLYGLYQNAKAIQEEQKAILVEGELDVLSSYQAGVKNVVAMKGTALTPNQINLLRRYTPTLLLALDQDSAGQAATRRSIELAQESGLTMRIVTLSFGKDVDDVAKASPKSWQQAIANALPYYDWLLDNTLATFDLSDPFAKKRAAEAMLPFLKSIDNEIIREHYLKQLAKRLDTSYESLRKTQYKLLQKNYRERSGRAGKIEKIDTKTAKLHETILLEYLLTLLLQSQNPKSFLKENVVFIDPQLLPVSAEKEIYTRLLETPNENISTKDFLASLPKELQQPAELLYLKEVELELINNEARLIADIKKVSQELYKNAVKKKLAVLTSKISKTPHTDKDQLQQLSVEFEQLKSELKSVAS